MRLVGLSTVALFLLTRCMPNACDAGDTRCRGRDLLTCEVGSCDTPDCLFSGPGNHWKVTTCEHACVKPSFPAFCASSTEPDQRCLFDNSSHCEDNDRVYCLGGYAEDRTSCTATGRVCVMDGAYDAVCALDPTPNPKCRVLNRTVAKFCDGKELVTCGLGYVTARTTCPLACAAPRDDYVFCAAASEPDPRCSTSEWPRTCPDDAPARCILDFLECLEPPPADDAGTGG